MTDALLVFTTLPSADKAAEIARVLVANGVRQAIPPARKAVALSTS